MSNLLLKDEHLEVLYLLLNEEQDPKYFLPHFEGICNELVNHGYMRLVSRITGKLKPQVEPLGLRAFMEHYHTRVIMHAMRAHAQKNELTDQHWNLLNELTTGNPIKADDIDNEITAYDLVNLGYAANIFPHSGTVYYCKTHEGSAAHAAHKESTLLTV